MPPSHDLDNRKFDHLLEQLPSPFILLSIGGTTFSNMIFLVDLDLLFHNMILVLQFPVAS